MSFIHILGLIFMISVPTIQGNDWGGIFEHKNTCNTTGCCCPPHQLTITSATDGMISSAFIPTGVHCKSTSMNLEINGSQTKQVVMANVGTFEVNTTNLAVLLEQNSTTTNDCTVIMTRSANLPVIPSGGNSNIKPQPPGNTNKASFNHHSILIKFLSILMTIIIIHI